MPPVSLGVYRALCSAAAGVTRGGKKNKSGSPFVFQSPLTCPRKRGVVRAAVVALLLSAAREHWRFVCALRLLCFPTASRSNRRLAARYRSVCDRYATPALCIWGNRVSSHCVSSGTRLSSGLSSLGLARFPHGRGWARNRRCPCRGKFASFSPPFACSCRCCPAKGNIRPVTLEVLFFTCTKGT